MNANHSAALRESWKKRKDYLGPDKKTSLHTTWRARVHTAKGKKAGFPKTWENFKGFKKEMLEGWEEGKILVRTDSKLPFSKDNCEWLDKGMECIYRLAKLEYNGVYRTLIEWCDKFDLNYQGVRQRYYKGKNYTPKQILFGKHCRDKRVITDHLKLNAQKRKTKVSKMLSQYKLRDKKKGFVYDLTKEFFCKNIISQPCIYCGTTKNIGCDRIDNEKGHTKNNVVPACYICNIVRSNNFTVSEMKLLGTVIKKINHQRNI